MTAGPSPSDGGPAEPPLRPRRAGWRSIIGFVLGMALLGAAVAAVVRAGPDLDAALNALRAAPAWMVAGLLVLPLVNTLATAGAFRALTSRFGRVGFGEMVALIATAGLLNYLPLRPGMFGRLAYHKAVNGIAVRDAIRVMIEALAVSVAALLVLAAGAALIGWSRAAAAWSWVVLLAPLALAVAVAVGAGSRRQSSAATAEAARWARAFAWRYADMGAWAARYGLAFAATGAGLSLLHTIALTITSQAAMVVPISGNGVGVREWAIGIVSAALHEPAVATGPESGRGGSSDGPAGGSGLAWVSGRALVAELVNRVAELAALVPAGLVAAWWVGRRLARAPGMQRC